MVVFFRSNLHFEPLCGYFEGVTPVQKNLYNTKKSKLTIFVDFDKQMLGEPF